jgi:two-component system OmpR family response regulator
MIKPLALIVEDDPHLNQIFTLALQADFEVHTAADGRTALAQLQKAVPEIIVLDLNLPFVSGRELLQHIKSDKRLAQTNVILATANSLEADQMREEVDIVLLKPISPTQLRALALRLKDRAR